MLALSEPFLLDWTLFGKPFRTAAIDLSRDWPDIEDSLMDITAPPNSDCDFVSAAALDTQVASV